MSKSIGSIRNSRGGQHANTNSFYYQKNRINPTMKQDDLWDFVIIGAGVSGIYSAEYLYEKYPEKSILIIEADSDIGGCVRSFHRSYNDISYANADKRRAIELGGMRYFANIMTNVHNSVLKHNVPYMEINITSDENLLLSDGSVNQIKNINTDYFDIISTKTFHFISSVLDISNIEDSVRFENRKLVFSDVSLAGKNLASLLVPNTISCKTFNSFRRNNGYNGFIESEISSCMTMYEVIDLSSFQQNVLVHGYQGLLKTIVQNISGIYVETIPKKTKGVSIVLNNKANAVNQRLNIISTAKGNIKSKRIIYTLPPKYMCDLIQNSITIPNIIDELQYGFWDFKAVKISLHYNRPWWDASFIGRNLADTPIGQLWVWDDVTLMIYCCDIAASFWMDILNIDENTNLGKTIVFKDNITSNEIPEWYEKDVLPLLYEIFTNVSDENREKSLELSGYGYSSWINNIPLWKSRKTSKYGSIVDRRELLRFPFGNTRKDHIYITNALSLRQGWVDGSIEEVYKTMEQLNL